MIIVEDNLIFESVKSCAEYLKTFSVNVTNVLIGKAKTTKGKTIKYYIV